MSAQAIEKGRSFDTKLTCCGGNVAVATTQGFFEMISLLRMWVRHLRRSYGEAQILYVNFRHITLQHCAFHHDIQFAHIVGPPVLLTQPATGGGGESKQVWTLQLIAVLAQEDVRQRWNVLAAMA
jgi:hypothetical protein